MLSLEEPLYFIVSVYSYTGINPIPSIKIRKWFRIHTNRILNIKFYNFTAASTTGSSINHSCGPTIGHDKFMTKSTGKNKTLAPRILSLASFENYR